MPQRLSIGGIQRKKVSVRIPGEGQPGIGRQDSRARSSWTDFMAPANLARLVIDRLNDSLAPQSVICARPSIGSIRRLGEINAPARMSIHNE